MIREILKILDVNISEFEIYISESFDINKQDTWDKERIKVAKLFYEFIVDLIDKNKITVDEIENLKTKKHSNSLFKKTYYPVISEKLHKRYRKNKLEFNSKEIYIIKEFFEEDRENIVEWYLSHI